MISSFNRDCEFLVTSYTRTKHSAVWCGGSHFDWAQGRFPLAEGQFGMENALFTGHGVTSKQNAEEKSSLLKKTFKFCSRYFIIEG